MSNHKPLVSVIVPAYNHEKFVGECIESIIKQTYENIELIIVNDGSKDNTSQVVKKYENKCKQRFNRFIFIDKKNEGICKTLNRGIKESSGKYICFLASDDLMLNSCINDLVNYYINNSVERIICNFYLYHYNINTKELYYNENPKWVNYMNLNRQKFYIENLLQNQITTFGMYCRTVFDKVGLFDESLLIEDWDMNLRLINKDIKLGYVSKPLYYYRKHSKNISSNINSYKFMLKGCLQIIRKVENDDSITFRNKEKVISKAKSNKYIGAAIFLKKIKDIHYK
ncbi:glycosyltransferase family 2 protein, partial [Clostridium coskatii]